MTRAYYFLTLPPSRTARGCGHGTGALNPFIFIFLSSFIKALNDLEIIQGPSRLLKWFQKPE